MPTALVPANLADLNLSSPALGPWFSTNVTIAPPTDSLSANLTLSASTDWLPPATGVLSLFIGGSQLPISIATLRNGQGAAPFGNNHLAAVYQLLPDVEERLDALMRFIPPVDANPPGTVPTTAGAAATRARVRWLALEFPDSFLGASPLDQIMTVIPSPNGSVTGDDRAAYLGFKLEGGHLTNGDSPMADLRRAGQYTLPLGGGTGQDKVLRNIPAGTYTLWAFDARGHAIDPGAVAAWWTYLGQIVFSNLWAPNVWPPATPINQQVVCAADAQFTVHLVNPHEGALAAPLLDGRLAVTGAVDGTIAVCSASNAASGMSFAFNPASDSNVDDAPIPRVALLPSGTYGDTLAVWPGGPVGTTTTATKLLQRDFVRVAAVDVERFLVGQERGTTSVTDSSTATEKRAADQNRASTRVNVARATNADAVLQPTIEAATDALLGIFATAAPRRLVSSTVSRGLGALPFTAGSETDPLAFHSASTLPTLPGGTTVPFDLNSDGATVPFYVVHALAGGDVQAAGVTVKQRVLFEFNLGAAFANAWIRVWPEGFDDVVGVHVRMDGGSGRVGADGKAHVVATLPDVGTIGPAAPAAFTAMLVTAGRSRTYADKRFDRPAPPATNTPATLSASSNWIVCETAESGTGATLGGKFFAGMNVVVDQGGGNFAIVDPSTLATGDFNPATLVTKLAAGDAIELTQPAFKSISDRLFPNGEPAPSTSTSGDPADHLGSICTVDVCPRVGAASILAPGGPSATMERLEVALSNVSGASLSGAIASAPGLGIYHELLTHDAAHPNSPGAAEMHGTGARLDGDAAIGIVEAVRDRTAGLGFSFFAGLDANQKTLVARSTPLLIAEAATTPLPTVSTTPPADHGVWAAVLRTVAPGVEGEAAGFAAKGAVAAGLYPLSGAVTTQLNNWLTQAVNALPTAAHAPVNNALSGLQPNELSVQRAFDRRIKASAFGLREAAVSINAAMSRAENFVYIETPALDSRGSGPTGASADPINIWSTLIGQATIRRGLCVIVCLPLHMVPGTPQPIEDVRTAMMLDALDELRRSAGDDRLAVFYPSAATGRSLRICSTTVIVDDAYALTGTTHLWRRGLSFDSSLSVAVFDDRLEDGRPKEVRTFRRRLMAGRLGIPLSQLPDNPGEVVKAINLLTQRGSSRVTATLPGQPGPFTPEGEATVLTYPTSADSGASTSDRDTWNPNGFDSALTFDNLWAKLRRTTAKNSVDSTLNGT
jgi:hypothetical protein